VGDEAIGQSVQLQPAFYEGALQEFFSEHGPSAKLRPPYYLTNIHLHGGSSGGPVFNFDGQVFGVASCSYEGATDIAFVTPTAALLEIEVPERITNEGDEVPKVSLHELAARGQIIAKRGKDA
jgi:S1-C subfamily serine protease